MTTVSECRVAELFDDPRMPELVKAYAEECGNALVGKPAPRRDLYERMERAGLGQAFAVRAEGRLTGFAMVVASVVPHYGLRCATTESVFVEEGSRGGLQLLEGMEAYAKRIGCITIFHVAPIGSRFHRLLRCRPEIYVATNVVVSRRLA